MESSWKALGKLLKSSWKALGKLLESSWKALGKANVEKWFCQKIWANELKHGLSDYYINCIFLQELTRHSIMTEAKFKYKQGGE